MKQTLSLRPFYFIITSVFLFNNICNAQISGSGTSLSVAPSTASIVDPSITVGGSTNITKATVQIASNFYAGDVLSFDASVASSYGISGSYAATAVSGVLTFTGTTSPANWQAIFRTVTYQNTAAACGPSSRSIIFIEGAYTYANFNGHYYSFVNTSLTWKNAKAAADASSFNGMQGYLATSTSVAENNFIWKLLSADAWIGASYDYQVVNAATGTTTFANQSAAIGNVYWVDGPEKGTFVSSGLGSPVAQNGQYMNWNSGEPNNSGNEYYIELYSSTQGKWNDLPAGSTLPYIIEYGGMPGDVPQSNTFTRRLSITTAVGGDISGGNDSVCAGTNSTILTSSAAVSGVSIVRWESSLDNFLTAGTAISNTSSTLTVTNLSQTTYFRSIANGNSCSTAASSSTKISVPIFSAGTVNATSTSFCGEGIAQLTFSGNTGTIVKWQSSTDANTWADITNTGSTYTSDSLPVGTYYYRVVTQAASSTCNTNAFSNSIVINVLAFNNSSVGGYISLSGSGCGYGNNGSLNLNAYTGNVIGWQYSTDNGVTWQDDYSGYSTQYYFNGISSTTEYRAVVQNGACANIVYSTAYTLTKASAAGNIWNGSSDNNFGNGGNWACGFVPNPGDDITIAVGSPNMPMLDQDRIIGNISFETNTNINVNGYALTIKGAVTGDSTGNITGSSSSSLIVAGSGDAGTLYFDHSNPGTSDVMNTLNVNMHKTTASVSSSSPVCTPVANWGYNGDGIINVTLGNINNSTASQNGYTDYTTSQYTSIVPSSNNTVSVTTDPNYGEEQAIIIWIDWNNDGIFGDGPNETIINYGGDYPGTYSFNFTAPAIGGDITAGPKRMRVYAEDYMYIWWGGGSFDPCNGWWGEYEDYQIDLSYSPSLVNSKFTLGNNLSIGNSVTFTSGVLKTNNNLLILSAGSTVSGASDSSHVNGNVCKVGNTAFTFPVGNDSLSAPVSMSAPSDIADHFTASYSQADPMSVYNNSNLTGGLLSLSNIEYWLLERTNGNSNVSVTIGWDSSRGTNVTDLNPLTVAHWNGTAWTSAGKAGEVTGTIKSGTLTSSLVTSFSPFALGTTSGTLGLTLINFTAVRNNQVADLAWQTTNETNTNYFDIERSTDGNTWAKIGSTKAMGNNNGINNYKFTDGYPINGNDYYRLKQFDNSGSFSYSAVRMIHFDASQNVLVYPSPFNSNVTIDAGINMIGDMSILDLNGRVVYHSKIATTKETLNLGWLATGLYTVKMNGNSFQIIKTE